MPPRFLAGLPLAGTGSLPGRELSSGDRRLEPLSRAWQSSEWTGIELAIARFKVGDHRTAIEIIESCLRDHPPSNTGLSFHAMFLATCPDDTLRDGHRALELAQQAQQLPAREELPCLAALAAAYAELGIFDRAVEFGPPRRQVAPSRLRAPARSPPRRLRGPAALPRLAAAGTGRKEQ